MNVPLQFLEVAIREEIEQTITIISTSSVASHTDTLKASICIETVAFLVTTLLSTLINICLHIQEPLNL